jgi:ParB/RepB/Spo0J family partition protein
MSKDKETGVAAFSAPANHLVEADPYLVAFSPTNPRKRRGLDIDSLNGLAASITAQGLAQPILVRPLPGSRAADTFQDREEGRPLATYELVCGERRLRASRLAEQATIQMLVRALDDQAALELQLVENIEREDLDPMEEADGFQLLRTRLGYSVEQIAERIGRGKGADYVRKTMKLLDLTPEGREALDEGHLGRSTGLLVARYPAEQQADVVAFIKNLADTNGTPAPFRSVAPKVFVRFNLDLKKAVWPIEDATLLPDAGACTECPKRSGAHADLFGDDGNSPDSCTDPDCFADKRAAHVERVKARAAKDGIKVIDGDEAKAAFYSPHSTAMVGYTRLDSVAYTDQGDDGKERDVTFEDALRSMGKKAPKPRLIINPYSGEAVKVITDELADKLQPEEEKPSAAGAFDKAFRRGAHDDRPDEQKALDDSQVRRAVVLRMFDAIRNRDRTDADMLLIAKTLFASVNDDDNLPSLESYLSWQDVADLGYGETLPAIFAKLDAMPPAELAAVITMAAVETAMTNYSSGFNREQEAALAAAYGIDIIAVRDKVAEDLERQDGVDDADADGGANDKTPDTTTNNADADQAEPEATETEAVHSAWPFPVPAAKVTKKKSRRLAKSEQEAV